MKVHLLFPDRDLNLEVEPPAGSADLAQDLGLDTVWRVMSGDDDHVDRVARRVLLDPLTDPDEIRYRQWALQDCLEHTDTVRALYDIAADGVAAQRSVFHGFFADRPARLLDRSVRVLQLHHEVLTRLRDLGEQRSGPFRSEAFTRLFASIADDLDDAYLKDLDEHLRELRFPHGELVSVRLGTGNRGVDHVLRHPRPENRTLFNRVGLARPTRSHTVPDRDQAGLRALDELRDRGLRDLADAAAQAVDHIEAFFAALQTELAFYLGCVTLHHALGGGCVRLSWPDPRPPGTHHHTATGLTDPVLALRTREPVVANDLAADGTDLVLVTGPNEGGKTTFLRSLGLATLMTQAGMFVTAEHYATPTRTRIRTHYKRDEDPDLRSGKLDEELHRMSETVDQLHRHALLLSNESFAATNEREGSAIAEDVFRALVDSGVTVAAVTHLYDLARALETDPDLPVTSLRAERRDDGQRTFRILPGAPEPTSHGHDLFTRVFGRAPEETTAGAHAGAVGKAGNA